MSVALLGVIAIQLYFLTESYDLQSKLFDRSVHEALNNVVDKLSKHDADKFLTQQVTDNSAIAPSQRQSKSAVYSPKVDQPHVQLVTDDDTLLTDKFSLTRKKQVDLLTDSLQKLILSQKIDEAFAAGVDVEFNVDPFGNFETRLVPLAAGRQYTHKGKIKKYDTLFVRFPDPQYGIVTLPQVRINPQWEKDQIRRSKDRQIRQVKKLITEASYQEVAQITSTNTSMKNLMADYQRAGEPLKNRIDRTWIDSLLRLELESRNIDVPFNYDVTNANGDSLIYTSIADGKKPFFTGDNIYKTAIFNKDVVNDPGMLKVSFPDKNSLILGRMKASMATTAGLIFVLIFCFGYTVTSIIRQKKISEMKTDFINNMTHEFKTPVSTIMIASESLRDPEINSDKSRVNRLANIIYEENARLGNHIERVLNVARIDKNDFKLENKPVNINDLISVVLDSMELKLQKCDAELTLELEAEHPVIIADELHFSNVLYNLVDNAIKYSEGKPKITINSFNKNGQVVIKVADEGIGMSRDQQTKIFEQFYRIPTGNVHNVKGFGLGLSYVNTIVKRLNGSISVRSEKDKGSEFELKFATA
ncbi:sensor histidine kinase [Mucilaginibacter auburnensis]|uniref:histidine kinase n=1 Tax=Mucilaginibacter auburnensis TaxID=1457233 RepID=A0A2H9VPF7_9SPHI|nr:HAMP domain-containing sensor histidine kinase [Mucilaginibacter auburnensis]PJJ80224.1 two-component system phosphate regulon sensor histidine kinase PhoR [Mucilaginibacter auburnensis]